jgi:hypothetical protein
MPAESLRMFPHRHILVYAVYISLLAVMQLSCPFLALWIGRSPFFRRRKLYKPLLQITAWGVFWYARCVAFALRSPY